MKKKPATKNIPATNKPAVTKKNTVATKTLLDKVNENSKRIFLYQKVCIFLVAFLVFANGIPNGFNLDDQYYTTKANPTASLGIKAIPKVFTTHTLYDNSSNSFDYRPIPMLTFVLQHQFISDTPQASHAINVIIYAFSCLIVFLLLCQWFGKTDTWLAFFITLLYAVHPLHTEVVDSIKNRDELLSVLFVLSSMLYAHKWYKTAKLPYAIFSILLFIIAMLCKKTIVTYIFVIPLSFYFFTDMRLGRIASIFGVLFFTFFLVFIFTSAFLLPPQHRVYLYLENPFYVANNSFALKTATASYIMGWYMLLQAMPYPLSFYYGYSYVPIVGWSNILSVISLLAYAALIFFTIKTIRKKNIAAFGFLFFLISIAPYSNLVKPAPGMMAERFAYSASLGYCIAICAALYYLFKIPLSSFWTSKNSKYFMLTLSVICITYASLSFSRNSDWENSYTLYSHDMKHLQQSAKANMLYGEQEIDQFNYYKKQMASLTGPVQGMARDSALYFINEGKLAFKRAVSISPTYGKALNNLGIAYINEDSLDEARKYLFMAYSVDSQNAELNYNIGLFFIKQGIKSQDRSYIDSAITQFNKVIKIDQRRMLAYKNLSMLQLKKADTASAIKTLQNAIVLLPQQAILDVELAKIYLSRNDTAKTIYYYEKGAEVPHPNAALLKLLENYYQKKNNPDKANYYKNKLDKANAEDE